MKLAFLLVIVALASCSRLDIPDTCSELGTIKKGSSLGLICSETFFIVKTDNTIIQPVITHDLLNGFSDGDQIKFGYKEVFVALVGCGANDIKTVELLCVQHSK